MNFWRTWPYTAGVTTETVAH